MPCALFQCLFDQEENEIVHLKSHGNSKSLLPYRRLFSSTLELMKHSEDQPKKELDKIYSSVSDPCEKYWRARLFVLSLHKE